MIETLLYLYGWATTSSLISWSLGNNYGSFHLSCNSNDSWELQRQHKIKHTLLEIVFLALEEKKSFQPFDSAVF